MSTKKRGLGRGLDALIQARPAEVSPKEAVRTLPIERLRPNRFQPRTRFDEGALEDLAQSIRTQGIIQPLIVSPAEGDAFWIVAGERRWRAARRAGLAEVPVVVREVAADRDLLELALVENLQRSDLDPIEEAEAYRALQEQFTLTHEAIAVRVGKSRAAVTNALRLLKLEPEVQELLLAGELSAGQARPLLVLAAERQLALARRAAQEGLSAREVERLAAEDQADSPAESAADSPPATNREKAAPKLDVHTAAAVETLTRRLKTRVEIRRRKKGGVVHVFFHSEEELIRLYDLFVGREG